MKVNIDNKEGLSKEQEDFIMKTVSVAIENYRRDKKLTPVVIMNNSKDDRTDIVMAIFGSQAEKEYTSQAIRKHVKELGADSLIMAIESYIIPQEYVEEFMKNRDKYPTVSSHPHRQDCIMLSFENELATWMTTIVVDEEKGEIISKEASFTKADKASGLMTNFIPKKSESLH